MLCFGLVFYSSHTTVSAATGINHQINFQGKLVNPSGTNVTDGTYSIVFSIYNVASAGSSLWTETQSVTVTNGIFQVNLGSVTTLPASVDFNTDNIYLGIKVGSDAEMTPRILFTAVPQAFNSEKLGGLDKTGFIQNTSTTQANTNLNIQSAADTTVTGVLKARASQSADLLQLQNSAGATLTALTASGALQGGNATGANVAGTGLSINGGQGTGTGVGGALTFQIAKPGTSGSSLNTLATVFSLGGTAGRALFQNVTDSTTGFQVQNAAGSGILVVDTYNGRLGVGTAAPTVALDVVGTVASSGGYIFPGDGVLQTNSSKALDNRTGIIIPMYIYPANVYTNADYNNVIALKKKYHNVPVTVILNPSSGPGTVTDGNYTAAIDRLKGAGVTVLGYVHTSYAAIALSTVKANVDTWTSLYPNIDGIYIDEMTNTATSPNLTYFASLTAYIHGKGLFPSVGNPGSGVPNDYFTSKTADRIITYENSPYATESNLKGDYSGGYADVTYKKRSALISGVSFNEDAIKTTKKYVGSLYVTNDTTPNPYDTLPTYLEDIFRILDTDTDTLYGDLTVTNSLEIGTLTPASTLTVRGGLVTQALPTPSAPTVTVNGTAGSTSWGYKISAYDGLGDTLASAETVITTGNATLTGANYNTVTWARVGGAVSYKIYRTTAGGTPATTGLVGTVLSSAAASGFNDTGIAASGSVPAANTSGGSSFAGILSANATGKTAITIADSGAQNSGITIGGDTNLYRSAAGELRTDGATRTIGRAGIGDEATIDPNKLLYVHEGLQATADSFGIASSIYQNTVSNTGAVTGVYGSGGTYNLGVGNTVAWTRGVSGQSGNQGGAAPGTVTNNAALYAFDSQNAGPVTNGYGLFVENQLGASNNYGVVIQGASTQALQIGSASDYTTANQGIAFGTSRDTNLYRSAASTLKTDGNLLVQTTSNSPLALQVLNAAGTSIFNVDTTNAKVGTADTATASTASAALTIKSGNATGTTSNSGNVTLDSGTATTTAGTVSIGTGAYAHSTTIGNTTGASGLTERVGTGNYSLDGVTNSTYTIGASTTTGTLTVGGTAQTGFLTLGSSTGVNTIRIGNGTGATTVSIANANTAGAVNIGSAFTTGTISIGGTGLQTGTINLGTGTGAQAINLGTGGTGAKTVTLGSTAGTSPLKLQSGTSGVLVKGTASTAAFQVQDSSAVNLFNINTSAKRISLDDASSTTGNLLVLDSVAAASLPTGVNGGLIYDSTNDKFKIYEGGAYKTLCNTTDLGCGAGGGGSAFLKDGNSFGTTTRLGTNDAQTLSFMTNGTDRIVIDQGNSRTYVNSWGTTNGFFVNGNATTVLDVDQSNNRVGIVNSTPQDALDVNGRIRFNTLGTADNNTVLCKNSTNQIATCTSSLGTSFLQNGNAFGTTAYLGTTDIQNLIFRTNSNDRIVIDQANSRTYVNSWGTTNGFYVNGNATIAFDVDQANNRVGIVNSTPLDALDVNGRIRFNTLGTADNNTVLCKNSTNQIATCNNSIGNAFLQNGNAFATTAYLGTTDNQNLIFRTNSSDRIVIDQGNSRTYVNSWGTSNGFFVNASGGVALDVDQANTRVGIVNSIPQDALDVNGRIRFNTLGTADNNTVLCKNSTNQIATCNSSLGTAFLQNGNAFGTNAYLGTTDAQNLIFRTSGTDRVVIDQGNSRTYFNSWGSTTGFFVQGNATTAFDVDQINNRVGILTAAPQDTLDVNGKIRFNSLGTADNNNVLCKNSANNQISTCNLNLSLAILNGGQTTASTIIVGTTDTNRLDLTQNSTARIQLDGANNRLYFNDYSSSAAVVFTGNGTNLLTGDTSSNRIGINNSGPNYTLDVSGIINTNSDYYQGGVAGSTFNCTSGQAVNGINIRGGIITAGTCATNGADLAEAYNSTDTLVAGELVMASGTAATSVNRADANANGRLMGIVSTSPGKLLGTEQVPNGYPIALSGRVPTKVNGEGGSIAVGDKIALSSVAGVGKKATGKGIVVGTALEAYSGTGTGTIEVFVNASYYDPTSGDAIQAGSADFGSLNVSGAATVGSLHVIGDAYVGGTLTVTKIAVVDLEISGHIITAGNAPTVAALGAAGAGAVVTVTGNDTSGTITVKTGATGLTAGELAKISFNKAYGAAPRVLLSPVGNASAAIQYNVGATNISDFSLGAALVPTANTTYTYYYHTEQ